VTNSLSEGNVSWYCSAAEVAKRSDLKGRPVKVSYVSQQSVNWLLGQWKAVPQVMRILAVRQKLYAATDTASHCSSSAFCLFKQLLFMLTYAVRFLCGENETCSPGEVRETNGAIDVYGFVDAHRK